MNSPFGKKMFEKNPISALQQNAFYAALNDAKEKGKDSFRVDGKTFQVEGNKSAVEMHTPLHKHGKLEKQLEILKNDPELAVKKGLSTEGQGGKDYEAIAALEKKIKKAKEDHKNKSDERPEEDRSQAREDEDAARGAAAEMAPLKKNDNPIEMGGYVGGADVAGGNYISTAGAYQNMFNQITDATNKAVSGMQDKEKNEKARLACEGTEAAPTGKKYKKVTDKDGKSNMECV